MKTFYLPGASCAAALLLLTPYAMAQSNVTVYGRLDTGVAFKTGVQGSSDNRANRFAAQSGNWGSSYLGVRGKDQIDSDLFAIFELETGLNTMTGAQTAGIGMLWGRMSWVGLSSHRFGTITMGRNLAMPNNQWDMDPLMQEAISSTTLSRSRTAPVTNNTISYQSPSSHGLDVYLQYGLGNSADGFNRGKLPGGYGRTDGVQLTWQHNELMLRVQFDELRDTDWRFSNIFLSSREVFLGAAYTIEKMTWQTGFSLLSAPDTPADLPDTASQIWIGGKYTATPHWAMQAGVFHIVVNAGAGDATHDAGGHATLLALGTTYHLSKRTFLYGTVGHVRNASTSTFGVTGASPGANNGNGDNPLPGHAQSGAYIGVMHTF